MRRLFGVFAMGAVAVAAGAPINAVAHLDARSVAGSAGGERYEAELWETHSPFRGQGRSVAVSPDGGFVYVTGFRGLRLGHAYSTVAYEAETGAERWTAFYNPADGASEFDSAAEVVVTPDGTKVLVTGFSYVSCCASDFATVAYDAATGAQLWAARYDSGSGTYDGGTSLAVTPDNNTVIVTGYRQGNGFCTDISTLAYDTATGRQRWKARYDGPGHDCDAGRAVRVTPDGSTAVVTGYSVGSGTNYDYATLAYDTVTGAQRWVARYRRSVSSVEFADSLAITADGATVAVTGTTQGSSSETDEDYATVAYDTATGTEQWTARYDGPVHGDDRPSSVAAAPDSLRVVVTGSSAGRWGDDYATVAYDTATGAERWTDRYNGPIDEDDLAHAAVVTPDGDVAVVTGSSEGRTGSNYATAFYDLATGSRFLVARYNQVGLTADAAYSVTISPDSRTAFVTGTSVGDDGRLHVGTVAYPT